MTQIYILINQLAVLVFTLIMTTNLAPPIKRYLTAITDSSPLAAGVLLYCSVSYLTNHGRCGLLTLPANGMWARALKDELSMRKGLCICEEAATMIQELFDPYARVLLVCEWMGLLSVGIYSTVFAGKAVWRLLG
ncbi:hypothetical protein BO86DRAFT_400821 [Aspergillus japonicus CBS 114.51]|uniref:Uncharacterized protein n=1 Tax=Aspergillus japonicus CBS 114.51 TaxID=1448312 RepID=A0A8T8WXE2_ASPJA|nr:hypothetical protein BO86DRAFT_400821 [Aspergillus japonicus CBS 114.51]RAH80518.1 hypothetical protein BO86DRAFT_400821 [Aspergillus japonicus CBS 114.51]